MGKCFIVPFKNIHFDGFISILLLMCRNMNKIKQMQAQGIIRATSIILKNIFEVIIYFEILRDLRNLVFSVHMSISPRTAPPSPHCFS